MTTVAYIVQIVKQDIHIWPLRVGSHLIDCYTGYKETLLIHYLTKVDVYFVTLRKT